MEKAGIIEEMVADAFDSAIDEDGLEEDTEEAVNKVLDELASEIRTLPAARRPVQLPGSFFSDAGHVLRLLQHRKWWKKPKRKMWMKTTYAVGWKLSRTEVYPRAFIQSWTFQGFCASRVRVVKECALV